MVGEDRDIFAAAIRKLNKLTKLNDLDIQAFATLPHMVVSCEAGTYLVRERQSKTSCCILLSGYACRHKTTFDGRRQIVSFHIPGDILDLEQVFFSGADHNVQTITKADYIVMSCKDLKRVVNARPNVAEALWRDTMIDASVFREWVLNVGRRNAKERVAHMLCEFACRIERAELGSAQRFELPMTQEDIADATGLTTVHVNRTLAVLSSEGVIARNRRDIRIVDWQRMKMVAGFDPSYLHEAA